MFAWLLTLLLFFRAALAGDAEMRPAPSLDRPEIAEIGRAHV